MITEFKSAIEYKGYILNIFAKDGDKEGKIFLVAKRSPEGTIPSNNGEFVVDTFPLLAKTFDPVEAHVSFSVYISKDEDALLEKIKKVEAEFFTETAIPGTPEEAAADEVAANASISLAVEEVVVEEPKPVAKKAPAKRKAPAKKPAAKKVEETLPADNDGVEKD